MREAALNADGFGFGWYTDQGEPVTYTNVCPMWSDRNLAGLGKTLVAPVWMANVRSATPGQDISHANTQPFADSTRLYLHNGYIENFRDGGRRPFHEYLSPQQQAQIQGNTDSEYLFAVFRQQAESGGDLEQALNATITVLPELLEGRPALFNVVVTDSREMVACRHAFNGAECPSLYSAEDLPGLPGSMVVASERFSDAPQWTAVPPHSMLCIREQRISGRITL